MELGRTFVQFFFGGSAPEILYSLNDEQKRRYLLPTIEGTRKFCFMLSGPASGRTRTTSRPKPCATATTG